MVTVTNVLIHTDLQYYAHIDYAVCLTCRGVTEIIILVHSARDVNLHDKTTAETSAVLAHDPFAGATDTPSAADSPVLRFVDVTQRR